MTPPLLQIDNLCVRFGSVSVVRQVSFAIAAGETVALVGESGSGKSTVARAIMRLIRAEGRVLWCGENLLELDGTRLRALRREFQMVFQSPLASLDPRMRIGDAIAEPLQLFEPQLDARTCRARVQGMLERVGLQADMVERYPHEFSGGQCQRIAIARAVILSPKLLVCDEAVSSLDVSIQGQIVNLLKELQRDLGLAMLFISHNLAVVRQVSHRILVMRQGEIVESGQRDALLAAPAHPYTRSLLAAVPEWPG